MSLDKYIHIYIDICAVNTQNQNRTFSSLENISMCPLQPVRSPQPLATIDLVFATTVLSFLEFM